MLFDIKESDLKLFYNKETEDETIYKLFINELVNDILHNMYVIYTTKLFDSFYDYMESLKKNDVDYPHSHKNIKVYEFEDLEKKFVEKQNCNFELLKKHFYNNINTNLNNINDLFNKYNKNKIFNINNHKINVGVFININNNKELVFSINVSQNGYNEEEINKLMNIENEFENIVFQKYKLWYEELIIPINNNDERMNNYVDELINNNNETELEKKYNLPDINCCKIIKECILKKLNMYDKKINYEKKFYRNGITHKLIMCVDYNSSMIDNKFEIYIKKIC